MKKNQKFICPNRYQCVLKIALILSFVIFPHVYVNILNQYIVRPIMSGVNDNDLLTSIGVLFACIIVFCCYIYWYRKEKAFNIIRILNVLMIAAVYLVCRKEGPWNFYRFSFLPAFAYADILAIPFLAEIIKWLFSRLLVNKLPIEKELRKPYKFYYFNRIRKFCRHHLNNVNNAFYTDTPCFKDDFKRKTLASLLFKKLKKTFSSYGEKNKDAFAVGICGPWGSGKTSFLNLLKRQMEQNAIYLEYKPWLCRNEKDILTEFFNLIKEKLSPYNRAISGNAEDYLNKLLQLDTSAFSRFLQLTTHLFKDSHSVSSEYEKLNKSIRKINQPIFIFLDDLDRLNEEEIFETLKIVRNTANFQNLFYVLAYDREHLLKTMSRKHSNPEMYLEKIINTEIVFPAFEDAVILDELKKKLKIAWKNLFGEEKNKERWEEMEKNIFNDLDSIPRYFGNFRDVNRFMNSFSISAGILLKEIKGYNEIYWPDFFRLEILKVKYQNIYNILKDNPTSILVEKKNLYSIDKERFKRQIELLEEYNPSIRHAREYARLKNAEEKRKSQSIWETGKDSPSKEEDSNNQFPSTASSENSDLILSLIEADQMKKSEGCLILLSSLFSERSGMNRVAQIQSFYKYFSYRIKEGEISLNEFVAVIYQEDCVEETLKGFIDMQKLDNLNNSFNILIQKRSEYDFAKILNAVLLYYKHLISKFPNNRKWLFYQMVPNWHLLFSPIDKKLDERNRITILKQFKDSGYNSIQSRLLAELYETQENINELILSTDDIAYLVGSIVLRKTENKYFINASFLRENSIFLTRIFGTTYKPKEESLVYKFNSFVQLMRFQKGSVSIEEDETGFLKMYEAISGEIRELISSESDHSGEES